MKILQIAALILFSLLFFSCGNEKDNKSAETSNVTETPKDTTAQTSYKIYTLPAPMQLAELLKGSIKNYSEELLKPTNTDKTMEGTAIKKSVLMGIYGVDMGYCIVSNQNQPAIKYISRIARLSDELKISGAFEAGTLKRLQSNLNNYDSATYIFLNSFNNARNYLRDNKRDDAGFLIASGTFIEGLHMSTYAAKKDKSDPVRKIIGQQKFFLNNIIELLGSYNSQEEIKALTDKFKDLKTVYDQLKIEAEPGKEPNTTVVKSITITDEQIASIDTKISAIRKLFVE